MEKLKWRRVIFHPFVIGIFFSALAIFLFARYIPQYSIKVIDEAKLTNNGEVYYFDLDNDGNSEKLHYYHYDKIFRPTLYLYDSEDNFRFLWNFFDSPIKKSKIFAGDYNNDNKGEIYVFVQKSDSIFLNVLDSEDDKRYYVHRAFIDCFDSLLGEIELQNLGLFNLDKSNLKEFIFLLNQGNRNRIYSFNIQSKELKSSPEFNEQIIEPITIKDLNDDDFAEIVVSNRAYNNKNDSSYSKLIILDHNLNYYIEPFIFPEKNAQQTSCIVTYDGESLIKVLSSTDNNSKVFNSLTTYNKNGDLISETILNIDNSLRFINFIDKENNYFLFTGKKLYKYNSEFKLKSTYKISSEDTCEYLGYADFGNNLKNELIFKTNDKIIIITDNFRNKTELQIDLKGKTNLSLIKSKNQHNLISIQADNKWYLLDYYKNESLLYSHVFYLTAFVFIIIFIMLLYKIKWIKFKKHFGIKNYQSLLTEVEGDINNEFSGLKKKIGSIKEKIDDKSYNQVIAEIDNTLESVKSISKKTSEIEFSSFDFKDDLERLILIKKEFLKINYFIYPEIWNGVKSEVKEIVYAITKSLLDLFIETSQNIQTNIQLIKHDKHINLIFEAEKVLLNEIKIKQTINLKSDLITKFNMDNSPDFGTVLNFQISLSDPENSKDAEKKSVKIIIAEDHDVSLFGLTSLFKMKSDIEVVGTAKNGMEVLKILESKKADVVITDISMPGMDGIELSERLKNEYPGIKVIVFTMYMENWFVEQLMKNGAMAFVSKSSKSNELVNAVYSVHEGQNYYCPQFKSKFGFKGSNGIKYNLDSLTTREMQIVNYFGDNLTKNEIAQKMQLNELTIDSYIANILLKVNAADEDEIIKIAKKQKFISE